LAKPTLDVAFDSQYDPLTQVVPGDVRIFDVRAVASVGNPSTIVATVVAVVTCVALAGVLVVYTLNCQLVAAAAATELFATWIRSIKFTPLFLSATVSSVPKVQLLGVALSLAPMA